MKKRKEEGNMIVDESGSLLVMLFTFVLILAFAAFSNLVKLKLDIDNVGKTYLYQMEQEGYLSSDMELLMIEDLALLGADKTKIDFTGTTHTEGNQAAYGEIMTLNCKVTLPNPLYELISAEEHKNAMFTIMGLTQTLEYEIKMSATAKW